MHRYCVYWEIDILSFNSNKNSFGRGNGNVWFLVWGDGKVLYFNYGVES